MPTYEFRLPDGTIIERSFKISEVPNEIPNPNGEGTAERIISGGAALLFKGSGFYLTDYGRNAHRTQGDAAKPAKEGSGSSESSAGPKEPSSEKSSDRSSEKSSDRSSDKSSDRSSDKPSDKPKTTSGSSGSSSGESKPAAAPKSEPKSSGSGPAAP
jgi:predicted nucleic acid-binding Zn ribbon protein